MAPISPALGVSGVLRIFEEVDDSNAALGPAEIIRNLRDRFVDSPAKRQRGRAADDSSPYPLVSNDPSAFERRDSHWILPDLGGRADAWCWDSQPGHPQQLERIGGQTYATLPRVHYLHLDIV
jgi:hypothetical protein